MANALTSLGAFWIGGASAPAGTPPADAACYSLLAFWMGGAGCGVTPTPTTRRHPGYDPRVFWIRDDEDMMVILEAFVRTRH